jgi:ATP-dependent helicase HrpB
MTFATPLPIDPILDELRSALTAHASAVLVAPPGAGKTTRVPLALMEEGWLEGRRILVLEPRRIAARAAAQRMAHSLSEDIGERIGLRTRMVSKTGPKARIEVVTEGVFSRMILDDPELPGIGAVLFDEFHERSLDADLGLALALDCQRALREDLRILAMSATLDGARVAQLLGGAPVIACEGRMFPVETRYLGRDANARLEDQMADAVMRALRAERGSILAFLPGQREIRRVEEQLNDRIKDTALVVAPLYGAMEITAQDRALEPAPKGMRKVVLASSIAETSITIEGIRVVIDSGVARLPRFEPDVGAKPYACLVPPPISAGVVPAVPSLVCAIVYGTNLKRRACPLLPNPKFVPLILPAYCWTARNGEQPTRARCHGSIRHRTPPSMPRAASSSGSKPSMREAASRPSVGGSGRCRCPPDWLV